MTKGSRIADHYPRRIEQRVLEMLRRIELANVRGLAVAALPSRSQKVESSTRERFRVHAARRLEAEASAETLGDTRTVHAWISICFRRKAGSLTTALPGRDTR